MSYIGDDPSYIFEAYRLELITKREARVLLGIDKAGEVVPLRPRPKSA